MWLVLGCDVWCGMGRFGCMRVCMCDCACVYINLLIYIYVYVHVHIYAYVTTHCSYAFHSYTSSLSQGALSLTGAKGKVDTGSQFMVFPDQLLPQLRDSITPRDVKKGGA